MLLNHHLLGLFFFLAVVSSQPTRLHKTAYFCLDTHIDALVNKSNASHLQYFWTPCQRKEHDRTSNEKRSQPTTPFEITFHCQHATYQTCQKAERAFRRASDMISNVILFREPIHINATLISFCEMKNECDKDIMTLGGSAPARAIPLLNSDGVFRLHPQALVKQFELSDRPAFASYDILSLFNADAPFWFEEDGVPIGPNQADFTFVILHEFMHGLGVYSGWNEYLHPSILTPDPSPFLANQIIEMIKPLTNTAMYATQFLESAMDRLMVRLDDPQTTVSNYTRQLNTIHAHNVASLVATSAFTAAVKDMSRLATQPRSLGVVLTSSSLEDVMVLETGLVPFQPGSSLSHVDFETYRGTPDFLMRFMQDRGLSLAEAVRQAGGGPIGPRLLRLLEALGYSTVQSPHVVPPLLLFQHARGPVAALARKSRQEIALSSSSPVQDVNGFYLLSIIVTVLYVI
ncbi:MAG: hypothetical protein EXX96DRAFT_578397 [Benjaminiella poitrasii]|nr:MAG: hypothetical protein EXX96DRAFT_578397 [Benjaminiella poitrasii]